MRKSDLGRMGGGRWPLVRRKKMLQILKAKIGSSVSEENALSYPSVSNINSFPHAFEE